MVNMSLLLSSGNISTSHAWEQFPSLTACAPYSVHPCQFVPPCAVLSLHRVGAAAVSLARYYHVGPCRSRQSVVAHAMALVVLLYRLERRTLQDDSNASDPAPTPDSETSSSHDETRLHGIWDCLSDSHGRTRQSLFSCVCHSSRWARDIDRKLDPWPTCRQPRQCASKSRCRWLKIRNVLGDFGGTRPPSGTQGLASASEVRQLSRDNARDTYR
jgi:hypothetical protein